MNELYQLFQPTLTVSGLKRFGLTLESVRASKILRGVVHSYLQVSALRATPYPIMPDGTQAVFIGPHGSIIGGAQQKACDIQIFQPGDYFGIRFYPGALRHFFDLNLSEITDQFADSHYFPWLDFHELHHHIYRCQSFQQRANICEQWLLRHFLLRPIAQFDQALALVYQSFGNITVNQLSRTVGWSSRHLNRLFRRYTGLSTKAFTQTIRVQRVCSQLYVTPEGSLNTALELGFFDQSHLIKDFRKRLLRNPSLFFDQFKSDFYNN